MAAKPSSGAGHGRRAARADRVPGNGRRADHNKRKGQLLDQEAGDMTVTIQALVPLASMFGFSTDLRSSTPGQGRVLHGVQGAPGGFMPDVQQKLIAEFPEDPQGVTPPFGA
ncbi:hypothetical protein FNF27_08362 [Cafeteria roenbergensis]|uniref:Elongation factor EFG domain-containing protein n=1 Tax=Cafeteria roenbergensis TaxID=33653 RepID=A0A5A8D0D5_CAFRO|nr:hypothetical protein FNF27_08362 [Cafeteria roenbergensis]